MDAGEIGPFKLDELIRHHKRAALTLEWEREEGEPETDRWEVGRLRRRGD